MRRTIVFGLLALVVAAGWLSWLVANPTTSTDPTGDAIFVHAGGNGERLRAAIALFEQGAAPVIVVSNPGGRSAQVPPGLCEVGPAVICVTPPTIDTAGEARALADLVNSEGWDKVVVVTSDYHLSRATMLDRSCTGASLEAVAARSRRRQPVITPARVEEALGLAYSWLFQLC